jgi:hypothetical protein
MENAIKATIAVKNCISQDFWEVVPTPDTTNPLTITLSNKAYPYIEAIAYF